MSDLLFPSRRQFLSTTVATSAALAVDSAASAEEAPGAVKIGTGKLTFTLDEKWGKLPKDMKYGYGCAIVVDSKDRIYVTSRSASPCVAIFDSAGKLLETWSKDFAEKVGFNEQQVAATAHGLYWSKEGNDEFLYWTENVAGGKNNKKIGARVYKTDLTGKVLYEIGNVEKETSTSQKFDFTNPTDVAIAPNGDIYVVDGYGSQKVHRFDKSFKLIKTMGGRGKEHGLFDTCNGIWVSTSKKEPEIYIADPRPTTASKSFRWNWSTRARSRVSGCRAASTSTTDISTFPSSVLASRSSTATTRSSLRWATARRNKRRRTPKLISRARTP